MKAPSNTIMAIAAIVCIGLLLLLQVSTTIFTVGKSKGFLQPGFIRGTTLYFKERPYTLNFEQQNAFIDLFNRSVPITKIAYFDKVYGLEKVTVHLFDKPDIEMAIIGKNSNGLIFNVKEWNPNGYVSDRSMGDLEALLSTSHDP